MSHEELDSSELATKDYWERAYRSEVDTYHDCGDVGEIWFGRDVAKRIVRWLCDNVPKDSSIADVGCGNGMLIMSLARQGFVKLTGLDYSENAVTLAREIALNEGLKDVRFVCSDMLKDNFSTNQYDIIVDKGTYDAISLGVESKRDRETFIVKVRDVLKDTGMFVITSCNWTKDELTRQFKDTFEMHVEIPNPQFQFGGKTGNTVTTLIFKKKK